MLLEHKESTCDEPINHQLSIKIRNENDDDEKNDHEKKRKTDRLGLGL